MPHTDSTSVYSSARRLWRTALFIIIILLLILNRKLLLQVVDFIVFMYYYSTVYNSATMCFSHRVFTFRLVSTVSYIMRLLRLFNKIMPQCNVKIMNIEVFD